MSACRTGCGRDSGVAVYLCDECKTAWDRSKEQKRVEAMMDEKEPPRASECGRIDVAFVDFCDRMRAERLNGGKA